MILRSKWLFLFGVFSSSIFLARAEPAFVSVTTEGCHVRMDEALAALSAANEREQRRAGDWAGDDHLTPEALREQTSPDISEPVVYSGHRSGRERGTTEEALGTSAARLLAIQDAFASEKAREEKQAAKDARKPPKPKKPTDVDEHALPGPRVMILEGDEITGPNIEKAKYLLGAVQKTHNGKFDEDSDYSDGGDDMAIGDGFSLSVDPVYYNPAGFALSKLLDKIPQFRGQRAVRQFGSELGLIWVSTTVGGFLPGVGEIGRMGIQFIQGLLEMANIPLGARTSATIFCLLKCAYGIYADGRSGPVVDVINGQIVNAGDPVSGDGTVMDSDVVTDTDSGDDAEPTPRNFERVPQNPGSYFGRLLKDVRNQASRDPISVAHVGANYFLPRTDQRIATTQQMNAVDNNGDYELPSGTLDPRDTSANRAIDVVYFQRPSADPSQPPTPVLMFIDLPL